MNERGGPSWEDGGGGWDSVSQHPFVGKQTANYSSDSPTSSSLGNFESMDVSMHDVVSLFDSISVLAGLSSLTGYGEYALMYRVRVVDTLCLSNRYHG